VDSKENVLKQIMTAWERAQAQLQSLRQSVAYTEELASLRVQSMGLMRERERAFRDLGEGVAKAVASGGLKLPRELDAVYAVLHRLDERRVTLSTVIADILQEGEAVARQAAKKTQAKPAASAKPLAPRAKPR
jgi:hypothetical protein